MTDIYKLFLVLGVVNIAFMFLALGVWMQTLAAIVDSRCKREIKAVGIITALTAIALGLIFIPLNIHWIMTFNNPEIGGFAALMWKLWDNIMGVFMIAMGVWSRLNLALLEMYFRDGA